MKKALLLFFCAATVMLSSCKKEVISPETTNLTILHDISVGDWQLTDDGLSYYVDIQVPENDAFYNQNGSVVVAMAFDDLDVFQGLPQPYQGRSYNFSYEPGFVTIFYDSLNGGPVSRPNSPSRAKISLLDGQLID